MLSITKTPEKAIQSTGYTSKWLATDSAIVFEVQRKDNNIATTANDGGKARITLSTSNSLFYLSVGEFISVYDAVSGVSFITSVFTKHSDTDYTLNITYSNQQFGYYVAYQKPVNYFFDVKLTVNGIDQAATLRYTPQLTGLAKCDISGYIQTYVSDEKTGAYIDNNTAELNQSGKFLFSVRENYIGNVNTSYVVNPNTWYFVKAARSIEKGTNLSEYVPNLEAPAKFLNYFEEPTYWLGLPFDISFVYSELLAGKPIKIIEEHYNSLNVLLSTQTKDLDSNAIGYINSAAIKADSIEPTCDYIKIKLVTDDAQPPVEVNTWYITSLPWSPSSPLKFVKNGTDVTVTGNFRRVQDIDLPSLSLTPLTLKPNVVLKTRAFDYANCKKLVVYKRSTFAYGNNVSNGFLTVGIASGTANNYKVYTKLIGLEVSTNSLFFVELKSALDSCNSLITAEYGSQAVSISLSNDTITAEDLGGKILGIFVRTTAITSLSWDGYPAQTNVGYDGFINCDYKLFDITTDGKIGNAESISFLGDNQITEDVYSPINFTYSIL